LWPCCVFAFTSVGTVTEREKTETHTCTQTRTKSGECAGGRDSHRIPIYTYTCTICITHIHTQALYM